MEYTFSCVTTKTNYLLCLGNSQMSFLGVNSADGPVIAMFTGMVIAMFVGMIIYQL